jgi:GNAT superfamily N-acetyltransferase
VPPAPLDVPEPFRLIDWDAERDAEAASLLSASNQGTIDGLFLCLPELPTREACLARLASIREGHFGDFLPDVSAMVLEGERIVGLLLATRSGPDEVFLYELALGRDVQGRGLAPMLIRRLQEASRARGLKGIRFMWCDRNRAVRKLFPPETIVTETREPWWIWRSEAYLLLRPKRGSLPIGG